MSVSADSGSMGGAGSEEFMVKSEVGEDNIVFCEHCGYSANEEKAMTMIEVVKPEKLKELEKSIYA